MFVELHAKSAFSFLEAAVLPEALAERAAALGQSALALVDQDGVYGAPRFYGACTRLGITPLVGAEVGMQGGGRLPLLVEDREGYKNLCRLLTRIKMRAPKGEGLAGWDDLEEHAGGLVCLTGGVEGPVARRLTRDGHEAARATLDRLAGLFGRFGVYAELQRALEREQETHNEWLSAEAGRLGLLLLASNAPLMAQREDRPLLDTLTCIRHGMTLPQAGRLLARNSERFLKPAREMERLFADCPAAVANSGELALRLGFTLKHLGYRFPDYPLPPGQTPVGFLRALCEKGAAARYGTGPLRGRARRQIEREIDLIGRLDLAGYFLIVWDLVEYCRRHDILVQGRGSAANSAVCYALGITAVDPVGMDLLFERFLSEERGEWPDIDLDLPSGDRRERVIQYVYERYGRLGAAMTANVITYRGRSAARDVGKALALPAALCDRLSGLVSDWEYKDPGDTLLVHLREAGCDPGEPVMRHFAHLWTAIQDLPRHLGQHSGGMVICAGRLDGVVPLEPAAMPGRSVVQWDKDDCAVMGMIKVDLLGLGMMALLEDAFGMIRRRGGRVDLAHLPPDDPTVYAMLKKADTIGVFQVESRAQMATLPRLKPECFYDLVVQVAIIRPGPIVGDMVHPYLRRRAGREPVTVPHPSLEPILARTLGVPLFQEQLLRMAMATAGFTGGEAEELRRAFGFKRRKQAMDEVERKLRAGMAGQGITGEAAEAIVRAITAFALYGFPESHAASFALLAYASAYLKAHHPAAFYAALLNNQPMGFYHPATIVGDAARHGQVIRPLDINHSDWLCAIEADGTVRLGLRYVRGLREEAGRLMERERPFSSADDLVRRAGLHRDEVARLAEIGALASLGLERRAAFWEIERAARPSGPLYVDLRARAGSSPLPPPLPPMTPSEALVADYEGTGLTLGPHPMVFHRARLARLGVARAADLRGMRHGALVRVAGAVVVRQRPGTAKGFVFLNLEDESGLVNVVVPPPLFQRCRLTLVGEPFLWVEGVLEHREGVISVRAGQLHPLHHRLRQVPSHDFH
ncbi:MAG TPA: error-prone DNA polymerase [Methylomirabilota bacterium]|nr:error-prone DNA polymerase [Methylomirabilota bacterium]